MFKFLFGKKSVEAVTETQRETVTRAMGEVNDILGQMAVKPSVAVDLNTGLVTIKLPEQMPDEALALPAPEKAVLQQDVELTSKPGEKAKAQDVGA